jgi:hypothetical protein
MQSLFFNTSGSYNTVNGIQSLFFNTSGSYNSANGYQSLFYSTTGVNNTADGYQSLLTNTTGNNNTAIGYGSAANTTTGSGNIAIGQNTNLASVTGSNQMNIGNAIFGTGLNGSVGAPAGNIGIGTVAPTAALDISNGGSSTVAALKLRKPFSGAVTDSILTWNAADSSVRTIRNTFASQTKTLNFSAEYAGAIVTSNGLGSAGIIGSMTAVNDTTSGAYRNAYNWTSSEITTQSYNIILRIQVPSDFKSWAPGTSFSIDYATSTTNGTIGYNIKKSDGTAIGSTVTGLNGVSWATNSQDLSASSVVAAGDYFVVIFTLNSLNNGTAKIGDVKLNYISQ